MKNFFLKKEHCCLLIVDIQDRLFSHVERGNEILFNVNKAIDGMKILNIPVVISEQYPEKMGQTVLSIREKLPQEKFHYFSKTTFSCMLNVAFKNYLKSLKINQCILVGIEAHVCILQTAKDLLKEAFEVVVLNDSISSRSIYDYSTAIAEMRDLGIRISSVETILFELLCDSKAQEFKAISQLIK